MHLSAGIVEHLSADRGIRPRAQRQAKCRRAKVRIVALSTTHWTELASRSTTACAGLNLILPTIFSGNDAVKRPRPPRRFIDKRMSPRSRALG